MSAGTVLVSGLGLPGLGAGSRIQHASLDDGASHRSRRPISRFAPPAAQPITFPNPRGKILNEIGDKNEAEISIQD